MKTIGWVGVPGSHRSTRCRSRNERSTARLSAKSPPEQASEPQTISSLGSAMAW